MYLALANYWQPVKICLHDVIDHAIVIVTVYFIQKRTIFDQAVIFKHGTKNVQNMATYALYCQPLSLPTINILW